MPTSWDFSDLYNTINEKLGGRKSVLTFFITLVGIAVDHFAVGGLSQNMLTLLISVLGTFTVGNIGEHFAKSKNIAYQYEVSAAGSDEDDAHEQATMSEAALEAIATQMTELSKNQAACTEALQWIIKYCQSLPTG